MPKSHMQHQREIDRASDIELDMERIEQDMREILLAGREFKLRYHPSGFLYPRTTVYDRDDVVDMMIELDADTHNRAVMMTRTDPIEAAKILTQLMARAVEQIIGLAPIREAAEFTEMENAA